VWVQKPNREMSTTAADLKRAMCRFRSWEDAFDGDIRDVDANLPTPLEMRL
jgi:hypothetical protein